MSAIDALLESDTDFNNFTQDTVLNLCAEIKQTFKNTVSRIQSLINNSSGSRRELLNLLEAERCAQRYLSFFSAYDALVRFLNVVRRLRSNTKIQIKKGTCQLILKKKQCLSESYKYTSEIAEADIVLWEKKKIAQMQENMYQRKIKSADSIQAIMQLRNT